MKKLICILFSLSVLVSQTFADKSRFYEGDKVIDTMYVDSVEGLRVRDKPSLNSNRLFGLVHRFPVKIVAIGKEETIDGITAPWVEILIPRYEWKGFEAEYGWVFGGYLTAKQPAFSTKGWTDWNFRQYLSKCKWCESNQPGPRLIYNFEENGDFKIQVEEHGAGAFGTWRTDFKNRTVSTRSAVEFAGDDDYTPEYKTVVYKIEITGEFSFSSDGRNFIPYTEPWVLSSEDFYKEFTSNSSEYNGDIKSMMFIFYSSESIADSLYQKGSSSLKDLCIRYGVYNFKNQDYMKTYHDYWNPIMAEHQKKADDMK